MASSLPSSCADLARGEGRMASNAPRVGRAVAASGRWRGLREREREREREKGLPTPRWSGDRECSGRRWY